MAREQRILYFALGVLSVVSVGAGVERLTSSGLSLGPTGITFPDGSVQTTAAAGERGYYLTASTHQGGDATTACAAGYHMASMWEILDPTQLDYQSALGLTQDDSGAGPPAFSPGWVRTGYFAASMQEDVDSLGDGGFRNCDAWASSDIDRDGTVVFLNVCWQEAADCAIPAQREQTLAPWWLADDRPCDSLSSVWCVAD